MDWQPIKTAPKGRLILVGYRNKLGNWSTTRGRWVSSEVIESYWEDAEAPEGWYEDPLEGEECYWIEPTHWMPLPEPPSDR